jgi:hypothetical protein
MSDPLIKPTGNLKRKSLKINLAEPLLDTMQAYMRYAGFDSEEDFIAKCIAYVLDSDKKFKKNSKEKAQKITEK